MEGFSQFTDAVQSLVTTIAIVVGAGWTYFRFGRERNYKPRFDLTIDAAKTTYRGVDFLICRTTVKNLGSSDIKLIPKHSTLRILTDVGPREDLDPLRWNSKGVSYQILREHEWIESTEIIRHDHAIQLPKDAPEIVLLELQLKTEIPRLFRSSSLVWVYTRKIVSTTCQWVPAVDDPGWVGLSGVE